MVTAKRTRRPSLTEVADTALVIADLREQLELADARTAALTDALGASLALHRRIGGYLPAADQIMLRAAVRQRVGDVLTDDERQLLRDHAALFVESWR